MDHLRYHSTLCQSNHSVIILLRLNLRFENSGPNQLNNNRFELISSKNYESLIYVHLVASTVETVNVHFSGPLLDICVSPFLFLRTYLSHLHS